MIVNKILIAMMFLSVTAHAETVKPEPEQMCSVKVCNKLERLTLNPFSALKDHLGESCFDAVLPKSQAVEGKVLSSESRWWQGSHFNPTKRSVTRVKQVYMCGN